MTQTPEPTPPVTPTSPLTPMPPVTPTQPVEGQAPVPVPQPPMPQPENLSQVASVTYPQSAAPVVVTAQPAPVVARHVPQHSSTFGPAQAAPPMPPHGGAPVPPHFTSGGSYPPAESHPVRKRGWAPVVGAAVIAAVLASAGTAGVVSLMDDNSPQPSSLSQVGQKPDESPRNVPVADSTSQNPNWEAVTKAVSPSVVSLQVSTGQGQAEGSGVIFDADGHILTNNHVVAGAEQIQVTLSDGRIFEAKVVGTDPTTDLAVVQLQNPPDDLKPATLGDSDKVSVGESVLAVGNPLGLANSATTGIVSAVDRPVSASGEGGGASVVTNAIQIDAAVNPGNSGGPLFNAQGEVIGITSSIATLSGGESGSIGLGFAIPVNLAKNIGQQLIDSGSAQHAFLGVSLTDATTTADGVTRRGAKVEQITSGSPAEKAGIKVDDVIVGIDGDAVGGAESLTGFVRERDADQPATITLVRDGKTVEIPVTLAAQPTTSTDQQPGQNGSTDPTNPNNLPGDLGGRG